MIELGNYIWKTKSSDLPVTVIGYMGELDGRGYARIKESNSAIPIDELEKVRVSNSSKPKPRPFLR